jgi:hypothetical protein
MDSFTASEDFYREDGIMNKISVPRAFADHVGSYPAALK